jgi:hypothetical protein
MHLLVGIGLGPVALPGPQRRLTAADARPALAAPAAVGADLRVQGVQGGGVDLAELGAAEGGQDVAVDGAAVVGHRDGRDGLDLLAQVNQRSTSSPTVQVRLPRRSPRSTCSSSSASTFLAWR